ncbi:unnamed protein product [Alternaria alternata]
MTDEGRQTTPEEHIDGKQQTEKVARERGGVEKGLGAEAVAKYVPGNKIQITEIIANKQKKKKLYVAFSRKTSSKKTEYQLTETAGDTTKLYMNGNRPTLPLAKTKMMKKTMDLSSHPVGQGRIQPKSGHSKNVRMATHDSQLFNASEQNFMLYRGFSNVHARLLLSHQASIQKLEAELDDMDRFHNTLPEASKKRLRSWDLDVAACRQEKEEAKEDGDEDEARTREDILEELRIKVNRYDELLIKARELISFQRPTERDYQSVRNWFHNSAPLVDEEQDYILWKEDIVTLRHGREWAGFARHGRSHVT